MFLLSGMSTASHVPHLYGPTVGLTSGRIFLPFLHAMLDCIPRRAALVLLVSPQTLKPLHLLFVGLLPSYGNLFSPAQDVSALVRSIGNLHHGEMVGIWGDTCSFHVEGIYQAGMVHRRLWSRHLSPQQFDRVPLSTGERVDQFFREVVLQHGSTCPAIPCTSAVRNHLWATTSREVKSI